LFIPIEGLFTVEAALRGDRERLPVIELVKKGQPLAERECQGVTAQACNLSSFAAWNCGVRIHIAASAISIGGIPVGAN